MDIDNPPPRLSVVQSLQYTPLASLNPLDDAIDVLPTMEMISPANSLLTKVSATAISQQHLPLSTGLSIKPITPANINGIKEALENVDLSYLQFQPIAQQLPPVASIASIHPTSQFAAGEGVFKQCIDQFSPILMDAIRQQEAYSLQSLNVLPRPADLLGSFKHDCGITSNVVQPESGHMSNHDLSQTKGINDVSPGQKKHSVEDSTDEAALLDARTPKVADSIDVGETLGKQDFEVIGQRSHSMKPSESLKQTEFMTKTVEQTVEATNNVAAAIKKLSIIMDSIYDAETQLPLPLAEQLMENNHFIVYCDNPVLRPSVLSKILTELDRINSYQNFTSLASHSVDQYQLMWVDNGIEPSDLTRLAKLCESAIKDIECLEISRTFARDRIEVSESTNSDDSNASVGSPADSTRENPSSSEVLADDERKLNTEGMNMNLQDVEQNVLKTFERVICGIESSSVILGLMIAMRGLERQLYSEDTITLIVDTLRNQIAGTVIPLYQDMQLVTDGSPQRTRVHPSLLTSRSVRQSLALLTSKVCDLEARITTLLTAVSKSYFGVKLPDTALVSVVFSGLAPLWVDADVNMALKLQGITMVRTAFSLGPSQQEWILNEILTNMVDMPTAKKQLRQYRLSNGKSIQLTSALVLQLIQVHCGSKKIDMLAGADDGVRHQKVFDAAKELLDAAASTVRSIFTFFFSRSIKKANEVTSKESHYQTLVRNFIDDVLAVLYYPEFPAAEFTIVVLTKMLVAYLDSDDRAVDYNLRLLSLEYIGSIFYCLRKRAMAIKCDRELPGLEISLDTSVASLENMWSLQLSILQYLQQIAQQDVSMLSARQFFAVDWLFNIMGPIVSSPMTISSVQAKLIVEIIQKYLVWFSSEDRMHISERSSISRSVALEASECLSSKKQLYMSSDLLLSKILRSLDAKEATLRSKALRLLASTVEIDPDVLAQPNVQAAVTAKLVDQSTSVRDCVLEVVGKFISQKNEGFDTYLESVLARVKDVGLNVRKRAMKILRDMYIKSDDHGMKAMIAFAILDRADDEDDNVRELAHKLFQELLFSPFSSKPDVDVSTKKDVSNRGLILIRVIKELGDITKPFTRTIIKLFEGKSGDTVKSVCGHIVDHLMEYIMLLDEESSPQSKTQILECIHTLHVLCNCDVKLLLGHIDVLEKYLDHSPKTDEERSIVYFVLQIYNTVLPHLTLSNTSAYIQLQRTVTAIIRFASLASVMSAAVECLCKLVSLITHQHEKIARIFQHSANMLVKFKLSYEAIGAKENESSVRRFLTLVGLIAQHYNLEEHRQSDPSAFANVIEFPPQQFVPYVYQLLMWYATAGPDCFRTTAIQSLGYTFRTYPGWLNRESTGQLITTIMKSDDKYSKVTLLNVIAEFLASEETKLEDGQKTEKENGFDKDAFMGTSLHNKVGGVPESIAQNYVQYFKECAMESYTPGDFSGSIVELSTDIIGHIAFGNLTSPRHIITTIVALEGSTHPLIRNKAISQHQSLHERFPSIIYTNWLEFFQQSFQFQAKQQSDIFPQGTLTREDGSRDAVLNALYIRIRDRKKDRKDFLRIACRMFEFDLRGCTAEEVNVPFCTFMAQILANLDYKCEEEVLSVIYHINKLISFQGITALSSLEKTSENQSKDTNLSDITLARISACTAILLKLKKYLKTVYDLKDSRCIKFNPNQSSKVGQRHVVRHDGLEFAIEDLKFSKSLITTEEDVKEQLTEVKFLIDEDTTLLTEEDELELEHHGTTLLTDPPNEPFSVGDIHMEGVEIQNQVVTSQKSIKTKKSQSTKSHGSSVSKKRKSTTSRKSGGKKRRKSMMASDPEDSNDDDYTM